VTDREGSEEIVYLGVDDVLALYGQIFGCSAAQARDQLRNLDGLEGAPARPLWQAHYGDADLAKQAAVLAHGIAESQLFIDGNKRTALASLRLFLLANGFDVSASQEERAGWILDLSEDLDEDGLAELLRTAMRSANGK
jgi:death-on-curing protein